jgi:Tfp pilus assembly protein FimT
MTSITRGALGETRRKHPVRSERGFTLVELIVYVSLLLVVLVIVAGLLINSLKSEQSVRSAAEASSLGQIIARAVQTDARNATAMQLSSPDSATTGVTDTQLLIMSTVKGDSGATSVCSAWFFVPARGGQLFTTESAARITAPSVAGVPTTPADKPVKAPTGWTSFGEGINRQGSAPIFAISAQELTMVFDVTAPGRKAVPISGSGTSRQTLTGTSPCF